MKYFIALMLGLISGAAICAVGVVYNPLIGQQELSPLAVTAAPTMTLTYSVVASENTLYTNDGESRTQPYPDKVLQLWEKSIRQSYAMATVMHDGRNQPAGFGIKMSSLSEETEPLSGQLLANSVWYVYLPGKGALFLEQSENYWDYFREVVVPGYRSAADTWSGTWLGNMTAGPGALGTATVIGGSGDYDGQHMIGVESLSVKTWRVDTGPVSGEGRLIVELPLAADTESTPQAE